MAQWEWSVRTVDGGISVKNKYINSVEIVLGSTNPLDQLQPALATVRFLGQPNSTAIADGIATTTTYKAEDLLGQRILINVDAADAAASNVFYGRVITYTQTPLTPDGEQVEIEITAQSFLDVFDQIPYGGEGLPAQTEFERLTATADLQRYPTWSDIPNVVTWDNLTDFWSGSDRTWLQLWWQDDAYRPVFEVRDDTPDNSLSLEAYAGGETTLLQYFINQAMGCGSWISEFPASGGANRFWYHSRVNQLDAVPTTIDVSAAALGYALTDTASIWDVYNDVTVSNSTLSASDWNGDSVERFGRRQLELQSPAANQSDLQTLATTKTAALSRPMPGLTTISLDYNSLPAAQRLWYLGDPTLRYLTGIPAAFGGDDYYYVRGLTIRGTKEQTTVDWVLMNKKVLAPGPMWRDVNATATWSSLTPTWIDWNS